MSEEKAKSRLAEAAEALAEAATLEADTITNKEVVAAIESLKTSFDAKINLLKSDISSMKAIMEEEQKQTRLYRARECVNLSSFIYYADGYKKESKDLAKEVLMWFSLGYGYNLPNGRMSYYEENHQAFRDKFSNQVKALIGRDPRLVKNENGVWTMYYS